MTVSAKKPTEKPVPPSATEPHPLATELLAALRKQGPELVFTEPLQPILQRARAITERPELLRLASDLVSLGAWLDLDMASAKAAKQVLALLEKLMPAVSVGGLGARSWDKARAHLDRMKAAEGKEPTRGLARASGKIGVGLRRGSPKGRSDG